MATDATQRKQRGAWYTPLDLVDRVVDATLADFRHTPGRPVRVLDPACGDGRFLRCVAERLAVLGHESTLTGCDIDERALRRAARSIGHPASLIQADALTRDWNESFDVVVGNPPFLSQMASATSRGRASRHGGGPYADAAAEFLSLAVTLAAADGGRVGLVLPQSVLGSRDAGAIRDDVARCSTLTWSWWEARQRHFDASVNVCAIALRRSTRPSSIDWTGVVTDRLGVPALAAGALSTGGTIGDRADLNANFRDEYYALVPAVGDDADGPPLVTSGLIDPGRCHWGDRAVRFAKQRFEHPRVDLSALSGRFPAWAERKLVPKVLVANQTRIIEAVADPAGAWLPGVPVTTATPFDAADLWRVAAVLTGPVPSVLAWQSGAGTGLSTTTVRVGPAAIAGLPWPAGSVDDAAAALRRGDLVRCAEMVTAAYGADRSDELVEWWIERLPAGVAGGSGPGERTAPVADPFDTIPPR